MAATGADTASSALTRPGRLVTISVQLARDEIPDFDSLAAARLASRSHILRLCIRLGLAELRRLEAEGKLVA